ncbi:MAG TPA: S8 family serine peptidase [Pyrinomonadaceae bacterium]|jgi:hypothetical protein|nr:S8 family serine peptidase [Pyrinomonadaceae bacterium]
MQRTGSFRFSKRTIFIGTLIAVLLMGGIFAIISYSPVTKAQREVDPGDAHTPGRAIIGNASYDQFSKADAATRIVRSPAQTAYRIAIHSMADRANAAKLGSVVEDYGSFVIVSSSKKVNLTRSGLDGAPLETTVNLPGKSFEPINNPPAETLRSAEGLGGRNYYIVQFAGTIKGEWMESLRSVGVDFLQYLPNNAYFIYADGEAVQKTISHSRVRWVGGFTPDAKLPSVLLDKLSAAKNRTQPRSDLTPLEITRKNSAVFDVAVFARADVDQIGADIANSFGGNVKHVIHLPNNFFNVVRVEMPVDQVERLASIPDVIRIDDYSTPKIEDERSAHIVSGNYTNATTISGPGYNPLTQFGVNGTNVTISMVDDGVSIPGTGGFYITSGNTLDGPLRGSTSGASGGHGHLNASIISGDAPFGGLDPTGHNYGMGVAPKSDIINIPLLKAGYSGLESDCYNDTLVTNGVNGIKGSISNNSWGNGLNSNVYDSYTAQFDGFVRDASAAGTIDPITLVFSAGNSGTSGLTRPKVAKNLIATGSSENLRPEIVNGSFPNGNNSIEDISTFSSRGPANDGRVKPDIMAPGGAVSGGRAGTGGSVSGQIDANTSYSFGTSHAAPNLAGVAALFTQFWKNGHSGVNPSPALIKAAVLLTAQEMTGTGAASAVPNAAEGWGRVNMKLMLNTGVAMKHVNETTTFSNVSDNVVYTGTVADASKPIRVVLVWTDPPAAAQPALVNNLDLTVTVGGSTYKGNVFTAGLSTTGGTADTLNNVENIRLPAGTAAGTPFSITVSAAALNGDGVLGNADATDQHFALVAYNFQDAAAPVSHERADFDGDGLSDISVFRPADGNWYVVRSSDSVITINTFGLTGDVIAPGDYDNDGKTDMAVFRPSSGTWYVQRSTAGLFIQNFGLSGDVPVQADYDNDGKTDVAVWRPSTGVWFIDRSTAGFTGQVFGVAGDLPVQADYDSDGVADVSVWRPSTGIWYLNRTTAGLAIVGWGSTGDMPGHGDFNGDGLMDLAVFRPSSGTWYVANQAGSALSITNWGLNGDLPGPADFDGDGKDDLNIFRPSTGVWFTLRSGGGVSGGPFGSSGDVPVQRGYIPQ